MSRLTVCFGALALVGFASLAACKNKCGPGTVDRGGTCVVASAEPFDSGVPSSGSAPIAGGSGGTSTSESGVSTSPAAGAGAGPTAGSSASAACAADAMPALETCDNLDNDCDGKIDESLEQPCGKSALGVCKMGTQTCSMGAYGECQGAIEPGVEVCDAEGLDENCDGVSNEGCACSPGGTLPCGKSTGICRPGTQACTQAGEWDRQCTGGVPPAAAELCDSAKADEDCDGMVDEGCDCVAGERGECEAGPGVCKRGIRTCEGGAWGPCTSITPRRSETCDGKLDEDCDNKVDEGCGCFDGETRECLDGVFGACRPGKQTCMSGSWTLCRSDAPKRAEACEGKVDEDCDGTIDEDCQCTNGASQECSDGVYGICKPGRQQCENGRWTKCVGAAPRVETCDMRKLDEDCDNKVDESCECSGTERAECEAAGEGICTAGTKTCVNGKWGVCTAAEKQAEICDQLDNDCDGMTDECPEFQACAMPMQKCLATGSYLTSCRNCAMNGTTLTCESCPDARQRARRASLVVTCSDVANCAGQLSCVDCLEQLEEQGTFDDVCTACTFQNGTLSCSCPGNNNAMQNVQTSDLPCPTGIRYLNGMLRCG